MSGEEDAALKEVLRTRGMFDPNPTLGDLGTSSAGFDSPPLGALFATADEPRGQLPFDTIDHFPAFFSANGPYQPSESVQRAEMANGLSTDHLNLDTANVGSNAPGEVQRSSVRDPEPLHTRPEQHAGSFQGTDTPTESNEVEGFINHLSDRMGRLQVGPQGQIQYYGPTSLYNLLEVPIPSKASDHRRSWMDGQDLFDFLGIGQEVPVLFEEHLVNLYFTWHNPSLYVVDREVYERAKHRWHTADEESPYYSGALNNAMYVQPRWKDSQYSGPLTMKAVALVLRPSRGITRTLSPILDPFRTSLLTERKRSSTSSLSRRVWQPFRRW
jgi:hypothetical protein